MKRILILLIFPLITGAQADSGSWIRINQLGYLPSGHKVAVLCIKGNSTTGDLTVQNSFRWELRLADTDSTVMTGSIGKDFGAYGPFLHTYRINFSSSTLPGKYYLAAGTARSPVFAIDDDVYKGAADFCLRYMRQQRSGFNPFLKDSCHTRDGYVLYGSKSGIRDSSFVDVSGGWHDASDYLQYSTTSANATWHLLAAYRDFPEVFSDHKMANGLDGPNEVPDVLDEARWGLDWLLKMHPEDRWMFNQLADDRDHIRMRLPALDSFYGRGAERPVYFIDGEPQQRGKQKNNTTGTSSTAGKFASAFALGSVVFSRSDPGYSELLNAKSISSLKFALQKRGVTQTVSVLSPYIYAEENWTDDLELAFASVAAYVKSRQFESAMPGMLDSAFFYATKEPITPWMQRDTAAHYQWYPFVNAGHFELAKQSKGKKKRDLLRFYRMGIELVRNRANSNAFYRGVPFIWCSNNLTTSFAIQCFWYRRLSGNEEFAELEQSNFDWLFGCNPWGTSMVYGLPASGDSPIDPHSAFTHLKNYPIDGGLVDGPVYTNIYKNLIGITLHDADEYAAFQSNLAVYHDDYGDYSTNEPTMDGTAALIYLLASREKYSKTKSGKTH